MRHMTAHSTEQPWYRVGVMWLFVGGLGAVVIGSFALLATAIAHADVELQEVPMKPTSYYRQAPPPEKIGTPVATPPRAPR